MKRILYKEPHYTSRMVLTVENFIENIINDHPYGDGQIAGLFNILDKSSNIMSRLIQVLVDKNLLTSDELFYIVKGIKNNDQIEIIEE